MAFTVEDGTGLAAANSFASLAEADDYLTDRGSTTWAAATDDQKQVALIKATDLIQAKYGARFRGLIKTSTQALAFPRTGIYDDLGTAIEGVPAILKNATAIYADAALAESLFNDVNTNEGFSVSSKKEKVGPIETDVSYNGGIASGAKRFPQADAMVISLTAYGVRVIRG